MFLMGWHLVALAAAAHLVAPPALSVPPVQLIDEHGSIDRTAADRHLLDSAFASTALNYSIIAIVGPQSSGKSSLLNALFGTSFTVMSAEAGRTRTTRGVWMQAGTPHAGRLLLDLQGADSLEAGEAGKRFERRVALLALALADVLCINLFEHDIGRHEGSNLALLQTVLELSLELRRAEAAEANSAAPSGRPRRTTLLFVIRDHVPEGGTPLGRLREQLGEHVAAVWREASRGEGGGEVALEELFDVQVVALPHYRLQPQLWEEQAARLAARFEGRAAEGEAVGGEGLLRQEGAPCSGVPADALTELISRVYERICANAVLHLPSQQRLVAELRCKQLAEAELRECRSRMRAVRSKLSALVTHHDSHETRRETASGVAPTPPRAFRFRVEKPLLKAVRRFDAAASRYGAEVAAGARQLLLEGEWRVLRPLATTQLRAIAHDVAETFPRLAEGAPPAASGEAGERGGGRQARRRCIKAFDDAASASAPAAPELRDVLSVRWSDQQKAHRQRLARTLDRAEAQLEGLRLRQELREAVAREARAVSALSAVHRTQALSASRANLPALASVALGLIVVYRLVLLLRRPVVPLVLLAVSYAVAPDVTLRMLNLVRRAVFERLPGQVSLLFSNHATESNDVLPVPSMASNSDVLPVPATDSKSTEASHSSASDSHTEETDQWCLHLTAAIEEMGVQDVRDVIMKVSTSRTVTILRARVLLELRVNAHEHALKPIACSTSQRHQRLAAGIILLRALPNFLIRR
ncbi:hypothetical protein AB1Y20_003392 [Prymnesium parvum]|uniref:GB1/RHD3-type G domain-containing protein n=1 Tax=Prymnesium parvum TaxID=97485 RepID=A0AB34JET8_PRYPA